MSSYLLLSCFKYVTVVEEVRLHLVDTARRDKDEVEDGKQSELQVKSPVADHPEGEARAKHGHQSKFGGPMDFPFVSFVPVNPMRCLLSFSICLALSLMVSGIATAKVTAERSERGVVVKIDGELFTEYLTKAGQSPAAR
jgi:hypothetical protein